MGVSAALSVVGMVVVVRVDAVVVAAVLSVDVGVVGCCPLRSAMSLSREECVLI